MGLNLLMYTEVVRHGVFSFLVPESISSYMAYSIGYGVSCKISYVAIVMVDVYVVPELASMYKMVLNVWCNCNNPLFSFCCFFIHCRS